MVAVQSMSPLGFSSSWKKAIHSQVSGGVEDLLTTLRLSAPLPHPQRLWGHFDPLSLMLRIKLYLYDGWSCWKVCVCALVSALSYGSKCGFKKVYILVVDQTLSFKPNVKKSRRHKPLLFRVSINAKVIEPGPIRSSTHWLPPPLFLLLLFLHQEQSPSNATSLAMMQEPQEVVEETVTIEEDPGTPTSHVSVVTSDDGTTRRTETKVGHAY